MKFDIMKEVNENIKTEYKEADIHREIHRIQNDIINPEGKIHKQRIRESEHRGINLTEDYNNLEILYIQRAIARLQKTNK